MVQQPAHTFGGPGGFAAPFVESTSFTPGRQEGAYGVTPLAQQPPRFTKLEFATYDGATDPLNWLNQCEQFFRGQRTLSSDRTWIASYHLRGTAQTWYYALERKKRRMRYANNGLLLAYKKLKRSFISITSNGCSGETTR